MSQKQPPVQEPRAFQWLRKGIRTGIIFILQCIPVPYLLLIRHDFGRLRYWPIILLIGFISLVSFFVGLDGFLLAYQLPTLVREWLQSAETMHVDRISFVVVLIGYGVFATVHLTRAWRVPFSKRPRRYVADPDYRGRSYLTYLLLFLPHRLVHTVLDPLLIYGIAYWSTPLVPLAFGWMGVLSALMVGWTEGRAWFRYGMAINRHRYALGEAEDRALMVNEDGEQEGELTAQEVQ